MSFTQLLVCVVHQVPGIVYGILDICSPFFYGMFVESIETGLVDKVDDGFRRICDFQGTVCLGGLSVFGICLEDGAEMNAFVRIANGVPCKGQLLVGCFDAVGDLCRENQFNVDALRHRRFDSHGNHLVGIAGKVFS